MQQQCQNHNLDNLYCQKEFVITSDDMSFYNKIGVLPPTFCSNCRLIRRMNNTNERVMYYRDCDHTSEKIMSMFPVDAKFPVYQTDAWYSDDWDPYQYGMDIDFNRPFFEQFLELQNKVPRMALVRQGKSINSEYCHRITNPKNCYMVFRFTNPEESCYLYIGADCIECIDCSFVTKCELCYECVDCENCYKIFFSQESVNCRDSMFLYGCNNCSDCIGCVNLRNKTYCIENVQYTKEEYLQKKEKMNLDSHTGIEIYKKKFKVFRKKFPQRASISLKVERTSGNWNTDCQNVENSFSCHNVRDGKNLFAVFNAQDCQDYFQWGNSAELVYESENCGIQVSSLFSCSQCWMGAHDLEYCDSCPGAGNCFGCIGLKKGEYSILNKKYSKEDYEELVQKIKQHMVDMPYIDKMGRVYMYGEHFPTEISPFAYNETAAQDFFPLARDQALALGYGWKDREKINYECTTESVMLPETISEVTDTIMDEIIECSQKDKEYSPGAYKITEQELFLYRKLNVPLPHDSFPVRYMDRLNMRPKLFIHERNCSKCANIVSTVYTEDSAPVIYCESCYQQEVI